MAIETRIEALSQAVRVSLALGGNEPDEQTVERAEAFNAFLTGTKAQA